MGRKRLNHAAETFCAMFCGWRLTNSYVELQTLGSGVLDIDVLEAKCNFNGSPISSVSIAHELNGWLLQDKQKHNIPITELSSALLSVVIELARVPAPPSPRSSFYIGKDGKPIDKGEFFKIAANCTSEIRTGDSTYRAIRSHHEQWPVGWPNI
ncbi:hypothetical protein [Massilia sp. BHUDP2]|uniref:hypothetical protein n=1 Tax=Massilia sp. BHUDP2 TaxID=3034505 RepID=UPI0039059345